LESWKLQQVVVEVGILYNGGRFPVKGKIGDLALVGPMGRFRTGALFWLVGAGKVATTATKIA